MRLATHILLFIAAPIINCQVKMRVREKDLIIPTQEPATTSPQHIKRRRRKGFGSTVAPHIHVAPTEPRIRVTTITITILSTITAKKGITDIVTPPMSPVITV